MVIKCASCVTFCPVSHYAINIILSFYQKNGDQYIYIYNYGLILYQDDDDALEETPYEKLHTQ